ncbi:MAG: glycosyltransferase [Parachlamydia sp.]|nr:glycosyltransferase [Parachlamydia sp.]
MSLDQLFSSLEDKYHDYEFPKVTVVIPTYNCSQLIGATLKSVLSQSYPDFEVIIVDGGSTDSTLAVIQSYRRETLRLYAVSEYRRYAMLNKGISQSEGGYINFLLPGDTYIAHDSLKFMMSLALEHQLPDLLYCGTLLREGRQDPKLLFRPLEINNLKKGQQPTSLQACWFKRELFDQIGNFHFSYDQRGGYELLCRFCKQGGLRSFATERVLIDFDLHFVTRRMVLQHFLETMHTIWRHFGSLATLRWLFIQKDVSRLIKLWMHSMRLALLGR